MLAIKKLRLNPAKVAGWMCVCCLAGCAPKGPRALLEGDRLIAEGKFSQAITVLEEARKTMPEDPRVWNWLGMAYHGAGDNARAVESYKRALTLDRSNVIFSAHFNLGSLYLETGNSAAAVTELASYCQLSNSAPALLKLGYAQVLARQFDAAERTYGQAMRLRPADPAPVNGLGMVYASRNRSREAAQFFQSALRIDPKYHPALLNLAVLHYQQPGQKNLALDAYRQYRSLHPPRPEGEGMQMFLKQLDRDLASMATPSNPPPVAAFSTNDVIVAKTGAAMKTNALTVVTQTMAKAAGTNLVALLSGAPSPRTNAAGPAVGQGAVVTATNAHQGVGFLPKTGVLSQTHTQASPSAIVAPTNRPVVAGSATALAPSQQVARVTSPLPAQDRATTTVTVVRLPEETPLKAARDVEPSGSSSARNPAIEASSRPASPTGEVAVTSESKPAKRNLLQKLNPFKRKPKPSSTNAASAQVEPTRIAPASVEVSNQAVASAVQPSVPQPSAPAPKPAPKPAPPPPPRYHYLGLAKPAPGNRAAADPLVAAGYQAQKARKLDEAARNYSAALQKDPTYFEACYNLTLVALEVGDLPAALHAGELALAIKPESNDARINFATALDRAGYWSDAVDELEKALKTAPDDAKTHLLLGNILAQKLGLPGRARPHYQRVLEIEPRHPRASEIRYWLAANP